MTEALTLADRAASIGEVPVGAVIVQNDSIIASSFNLRESQQDPTAHAELLALRQAAKTLNSWRLTDCTVYVTLEPCAMCAGAMVLARIKHCVFGCTDPKGGFTGSLADLSAWPGLNHHFDVTSGILEEECRQRLQLFFRNRR